MATETRVQKFFLTAVVGPKLLRPASEGQPAVYFDDTAEGVTAEDMFALCGCYAEHGVPWTMVEGGFACRRCGTTLLTREE